MGSNESLTNKLNIYIYVIRVQTKSARYDINSGDHNNIHLVGMYEIPMNAKRHNSTEYRYVIQ